MEALFRRLLQLTRKDEGVAVPLVPDDVHLSGLGDLWPKFVSQCSRCEMFSLKQVESRPHSIFSTSSTKRAFFLVRFFASAIGI